MRTYSGRRQVLILGRFIRHRRFRATFNAWKVVATRQADFSLGRQVHRAIRLILIWAGKSRKTLAFLLIKLIYLKRVDIIRLMKVRSLLAGNGLSIPKNMGLDG